MATSQEMLDKYLAAEQAILEGQDISFDGRRLSMPDLPEIREGRKEWEQRVADEAASNKKVRKMGGINYSVARFDQ